MSRLVFLDASALIAAARGQPEIAQPIIEVIDDPDTRLASSGFVRLEVLPKAVYNQQTIEAAFYNEIFSRVAAWADVNSRLLDLAYSEASRHGMSAVDALHVAAAALTGADELVTLEQVTKPLHRTNRVRVRRISPQATG